MTTSNDASRGRTPAESQHHTQPAAAPAARRSQGDAATASAARQSGRSHTGNGQQHPHMRPAPGPRGGASPAASAGHQRRTAAQHPAARAGRGAASSADRAKAAQAQAQGSAHPHQGARTQSARTPHGARTTAPRPAYVSRQRRDAGQGGGRAVVATVAALAAVALVGVAIGYQFFWRPVDVTVNGQSVSGQIGTSVEQLLQDNDYFGVKAGRLLSLGGNVLDESGGDRCAVSCGGETLDAQAQQDTKLTDGLELAVADGADQTETHTEQTVDMAPGLQRDGTGAIQFVSQWGKTGKKTVWTGDRSGETVDKEVLEPATDMVVSSYNPKPSDGKKYVALTFDDGPSSYTQDILDILKRYGVTATFFNLGSQVNAKSKAVLDGGNELASHTNQHMNLPNCDRDTLRNEISTAFDAIEQASGVRPQMIRAPYGAFTSTEWARSADLISCNVLWNIDTLDWKRPGAEAIKNAVLSGAYNGAIILMHDGGGNRSQDVEALPGIIEGLQADGYELVTVSKLMELDGRFPQDVIDGTVSMPKDATLPEM